MWVIRVVVRVIRVIRVIKLIRVSRDIKVIIGERERGKKSEEKRRKSR